MKFFTQLLSVFFFFFCSTFLFNQKTFAQCRLLSQAVELSSMPVSCDSLVFVSTGEDSLFAVGCVTIVNAWIVSHPDDADGLTGITNFYFEIHQADFDAMLAWQQQDILDSPSFYHLLP